MSDKGFPTEVERVERVEKVAGLAREPRIRGVKFEWFEAYNRETVSFDQYKVVNICHLIDHLFGADWSKHPTYEESGEAVMRWCEDNNAAYYAADRENFFIRAACDQASKEGKNVVVVEDLS
jgi:hypothetical protein|tara:strand:- start:223 stop:588 length:366 start_codon:yes stop_codon:yes gene_type:complete